MAPTIVRNLRSSSLLAGGAVWAASLGLYLSTLAPTLTWGYNKWAWDAGDILAAAYTWGIPHPTGYPTYTLLLGLFGRIVPFGDFAYRGNLLSALLASLAVALLYWFILLLCRFLRPQGPPYLWIAGAVLGASAFAASPLFWSQAVNTEVYTLNAAFAAALLVVAGHLALRGPPDGEPTPRSVARRMALFGLLVGLGLGNHLTLLAVAVPLLAWIGVSRGLRTLLSPWLVGALLLGLSVYLYLPVRAIGNPPINWGDPDSLERFLRTVSARDYHRGVLSVPARSLVRAFASWTNLTLAQFNPLGLLLGVAGLAALIKREPRLSIASFTSVVLASTFSITYFSPDAAIHSIPAFMMVSVWAGAGLFWALSVAWAWGQRSRRFPRPRVPKVAPFVLAVSLGAMVFIALPITSVALNYKAQDRRHDRLAYEYADAIVSGVPDGSIVVALGDLPALSLFYMRYVERRERDFAPVAEGLLTDDWYWRSLRDRYPDRFPSERPTDLAQALIRLGLHNRGRGNLYFTYQDPFVADWFEEEPIRMQGPSGAVLYRAELKPLEKPYHQGIEGFKQVATETRLRYSGVPNIQEGQQLVGESIALRDVVVHREGAAITEYLEVGERGRAHLYWVTWDLNEITVAVARSEEALRAVQEKETELTSILLGGLARNEDPTPALAAALGTGNPHALDRVLRFLVRDLYVVDLASGEAEPFLDHQFKALVSREGSPEPFPETLLAWHLVSSVGSTNSLPWTDGSFGIVLMETPQEVSKEQRTLALTYVEGEPVSARLGPYRFRLVRLSDEARVYLADSPVALRSLEQAHGADPQALLRGWIEARAREPGHTEELRRFLEGTRPRIGGPSRPTVGS